MQLLEEQRENWGTRGGFILAAVGSAVGLGNLWGFPYKLYSYGGGAFLLPYILAMFVIGIPLLILEFSLGHFTQRSAPQAFSRTSSRFEFVGWWGILLAFVIITYYPVILAYCFSFLWISVKGIFDGGQLPWAGEGVEGVANAKEFFYDTYLQFVPGRALISVNWSLLLPLIITWLVMYFCIFKGVKLVGRIVWLTVPLPWIMLLILTVRGLTLEGSMQGLAFYLNPDWSELLKPVTWRFAFGQVFFSLSLAFGVMVTYASFLHKKSDINNNAVIIGLSDFATSFVAGIAIFATIGGMAFATQQSGSSVPVNEVVDKGPGLAFVAFPYALAQLPNAAWFSFIFFFALVTLGVDSAFSITESCLAAIVDKTGWKRCLVLPAMSIVGLSTGLIFITRGGLNWLGTVDDFVNGTWGIAFMGLLEALVLGWAYSIDKLRRHANDRSDWKLGVWWNYTIRIFIPIVLGTLFVWNLIDNFLPAGRTPIVGFFIDNDGGLIVQNAVGMSIMAIVPIIAIAMSMIKSPYKHNYVPHDHSGKVSLGRLNGIAGIIFTSVALVFMTVALLLSNVYATQILLVIAVLASISGIIMGNYVLDQAEKNNCRSSRWARWAGVIGTIQISTIIAVVLNRISIALSDNAGSTKPAGEFENQLTGTSYVILTAVVLLIVVGLAWCFYPAILAAAKEEQADEQLPEEE